jgi:hypothetical protein
MKILSTCIFHRKHDVCRNHLVLVRTDTFDSTLLHFLRSVFPSLHILLLILIRTLHGLKWVLKFQDDAQ